MPDPTSPGETETAEKSRDTSTDNNPSATELASSGVVRQREIGGRPGADPTRYGDWEKNGRCIDF